MLLLLLTSISLEPSKCIYIITLFLVDRSILGFLKIGFVSCATRYLPTPLNLKIWKLDGKINNSIKRIIDARLKAKSKNVEKDYGNDLLGIMLASSRSNETEKKMSTNEIIEECKTFFFAGHETTANLLTWTTMLLSLHQDWQEKLREEVLNECGKDKIPDSDNCSKLKLVNANCKRFCFLIMCFLRAKKPLLFLT